MSGNCRNPKVEPEVSKRYHEIVDELLDEDVILHKKIKTALIPPEVQVRIEQLQAELTVAKADLRQGHICNACLKNQLEHGKHDCDINQDGCEIEDMIDKLKTKNDRFKKALLWIAEHASCEFSCSDCEPDVVCEKRVALKALEGGEK